jgi:hypothetical protein
MTRLLSAAVAALLLTLTAAADDKSAAKPAKAGGPLVGHMVYFKLKDGSPAARQKLVAACDKYLSVHEGTVVYAAGPIGEDFKRDVNDRDWDVALHLIFATKADYDRYATHPEHLKFIAENKDTWAKVRVFDSELAGVKLGKKPATTTAK